ncbi:DUF2634 domain-containing protein [Virgibacillus sp. FSP13]
MPNLFPEDVTDDLNVEDIDESEIVEFGRSWKFDFEKGEFVLNPVGKVVETSPYDAWVEWCQKAMYTQRYRYLIYSDDHGQEFDELIQLDLTRDANESEIQRMVTECLMVNPRTESVGNFSFEWEKDKLYFSFDLYNVMGDRLRMDESVVVK